MPYNVELCYGYFEGECGIYHAFRLVAPEKDFPDDVEKSLAESLETKADNPNFKWDCIAGCHCGTHQSGWCTGVSYCSER